MTALPPLIVAAEDVGIRTSAAILITEDDRYLLQHRDNDPQIFFPDMLCLFGGALEEGESPEAGLRRELREELELEAGGMRYFTRLAFDAIYADGGLCQRYYFEVPIKPGLMDSLVLREGAAMRLMTANDIAEESFRFVPYDLGILRMHMLLWRKDGERLGGETGLSVAGS
jgi:8-oxo-dGTP pyrophosphatase MutT (NUDIX family)